MVQPGSWSREACDRCLGQKAARKLRAMQSLLTTLSIIAIVTMTLLGCGKAEYEQKMTGAIKNLAFTSRFIENLHINPTEIGNGVAELRLPLYVKNTATPLTMTSRNRNRTPMSPDRIQPPSLRIPGFLYSYELFVDGSNPDDKRDKETLYLYFASVPATEKLSAIEATLKAGAAKTVPKSRPAFVDASLDTPDRKKIAFRKMSLTGTQSFNMDAGTPESENRAGQFDVYIHSGATHHVIIGVRCTAGGIEAVNAMENASYALGTLKMLGDAPQDDA